MSSSQGATQKSKTEYAYPGLGLPLRENGELSKRSFPIGAHGNCRGSASEVVPVRELAMMSIMETLTDKPDWHKKVFDEEIIARWRKEALAIPNEHWWELATKFKRQSWNDDGELEISDYGSYAGEVTEGIMSGGTFDCCIHELRNKARYFEKTGIVPTLDAYASVAKADNFVSEDLHAELLDAFHTLKEDQAKAPDWHPNSKEMVQNLIHPSNYPLVYQRSKVFKEEVVGVKDAISKWAGKGDVIQGEEKWKPTEDERREYYPGSGKVPLDYWSVKYQWLPSNVAFQDDGTVRFTSYINNLHPERYPDIYRSIEKLVETSLPMWDQCLTSIVGYDEREGAGRTEGRFGVPDKPFDYSDDNGKNWIPSDFKECADAEISKKDLEDIGWYDSMEGDYDGWEEELARHKWEILRKPVIPEPPVQDIDYAPQSRKRLVDRFRESGLQVIVKIASIELTPEKPHFPQGSWHVEGQMNEHICATALYYLDSENITSSTLSFRMQTPATMIEEEVWNVGQGAFRWMESFYGTSLGDWGSPHLQNYGFVETREKRLLAFPNVFQHRVSPFELVDKTKPGHRRFIALWLVDPHRRIISTANVPPQQLSWWADSILGSTDEARKDALSKLPPEFVDMLRERGAVSRMADEEPKLPEELMDMVREYLNTDANALLMSRAEAEEHRAELMKERGAFKQAASKSWQETVYNFCEH